MTLVAVSFSQSNPSTYPSLAPTFLTFMNMLTGGTQTPPGITQLAFTGIYMFPHTTTTPFYFLLDGITTNSSTDRYVFGVLGPIQQVDIQLTQLSSTLSAYNSTLVAYNSSLSAVGSSLVSLGNTNIALGTTNFALGTSIYAIGVSTYAIATTILASEISSASLMSDISSRIGTTASSYGSTSVDPGTLYGFMKRNQEVLEGDQTFNKVTGAWDINTRGGTLLTQKTLSQTSTDVTKS